MSSASEFPIWSMSSCVDDLMITRNGYQLETMIYIDILQSKLLPGEYRITNFIMVVI
jgi:hypothetical protein